MAYRKYDTCFFERYAMTELQQLLGHKFDGLVNCDRPDLQTPDAMTLGIEVTRAMEGGRQAALKMLKDISGISAVPGDSASDLDAMKSSGYGYGLREGRNTQEMYVYPCKFSALFWYSKHTGFIGLETIFHSSDKYLQRT